MTDAMPRFVIVKHGVEMDVIGAVSYRQAITRARKAYGRCEVLAVGNVAVARADNRSAGYHNEGRTYGRSPVATPDFEARRAALIAQHKVAAL